MQDPLAPSVPPEATGSAVAEDDGRWRWLLLVGLVGLFLLATTTPRGSETRWVWNGVERGPDSATFAAPGLLRSDDAPGWIRDAIAAGRVGIELEVTPSVAAQTGPARILSVSMDPWRRNLTIAQEHRDLVVRVRRHGASQNGTPPFVVPDVFERAQPVRIDVALDGDGMRVAVDGVARLSVGWAASPPFELWDPGYPIGLGNELTWNRPWLGTVSVASLAVGGESVNLLAPGALAAPVAGSPALPFAWFSSSLADLALNFLLMIPMGLLTAWVARSPGMLRAVLLWVPVVLLAESIQLVIPGRFPSASDVLLNLAGVLVGSAIAVRWRLGGR